MYGFSTDILFNTSDSNSQHSDEVTNIKHRILIICKAHFLKNPDFHFHVQFDVQKNIKTPARLNLTLYDKATCINFNDMYIINYIPCVSKNIHIKVISHEMKIRRVTCNSATLHYIFK